MEKYLIKSPSTTKAKAKVPLPSTTFELLGDEIQSNEIKDIIIGFLGHSTASFWTRESIVDTLLNPLIGELTSLPASILIPTEGLTSMLLQIWSERQGISVTPLVADWTRLGRKAQALRDGKILKESSHLVIFLGKKSDRYEKIAIREVKKGKRVFTIDYASKELIEYIV